uniref:Abhydrolase domain containing 14B n=1 Tax=Ovis aries TaxID=9940 RepID=A0AC11E100_SHEEP
HSSTHLPATDCRHKRAPWSTAQPPPSGGPPPSFPAPAPSLLPRPGPSRRLLACLLAQLPRRAPRVLGASFAATGETPALSRAASLLHVGRAFCGTSTAAGLGRSKEAKAPAPIGELVPSSFLAAVVDALDLGPPVVISPSLSGMYSLPFLTAPGSQLRGYVPVAPICTDKINAADYARVKASVLIVYGDQDPMGQTSFEHLKQLPNHRVLVMEGAGHPCYLDKPEEWHTGLLDFLRGLA